MSDRETADFLATVPLFDGLEEADLAELARVVRRRTMREGQVLFRQGDPARDVLFVVDGTISTSLGVPGEHAMEIATVRSGQIIGEIAMLDGSGHTLSARVTEAATVLALSRLDFVALLVAQHPTAFRLRRRLICHLTVRLRNQLQHLADSLDGHSDGLPAEGAAPVPADLEPCKPPDSKYIRRMAAFTDFDPLALWGFLTSGKYVRCPPGRTLVSEGTPSEAYYLTVNGAVEKVLVRGDQRIRVGLAGPGMAFGYESLIDGDPSPFAAITRERAVLLTLRRDVFDQLFYREDAIARVFLEAVQHDLLVTLRQALRPCARLASSV